MNAKLLQFPLAKPMVCIFRLNKAKHPVVYYAIDRYGHKIGNYVVIENLLTTAQCPIVRRINFLVFTTILLLLFFFSFFAVIGFDGMEKRLR